MNVYLKTLGCRLNEAEAQMWAKEYEDHGLNIVSDVKDAQICVVNSCAVTSSAVSKSKKQARKLKTLNKDVHVVLSGCFASLEEKKALAIKEVDQVIVNKDKDMLVARTLEKIGFRKSETSSLPSSPLLNAHKHSRAFIKVQDGCRNRCSFCIVTVARGDEKSRTVSDVVDDVLRHEQAGFNEIVITGVHLGGYGSDIGENLTHLLDAILQKTQIKRIRLGSLEPWDIPERFFDLWQNPRLMPHFHLPLQSGCDKTLKRMARRCMSGDYLELVTRARAAIPHLNITTDVIVGFPGEDESEWQDSKDFINKMAFGHIHVFPYSIREGTKAALLPNHQNAEVKKQRSHELITLAKEAKINFVKSQIGLSSDILFENKTATHEGNSVIFGLSENYIRVASSTHHNLKRNEIHRRILTDVISVDNEPILMV